MRGYRYVGGRGKTKLLFSGENSIPRAPHLHLCTLVVDTNVRNSTMRCFFIFIKGTKPLRWFIPLKP